MRANFNSSSKPRLACEIAADRVVAGRVSERGHTVDACTAGELAAGSVVPDLLEANLRERQRDLLSTQVGALLSRFRWVDALPERWSGAVIASEVLDAVPAQAITCVQLDDVCDEPLADQKLESRYHRELPGRTAAELVRRVRARARCSASFE